jgi:hypothetical protein
MSVTCSPKTRPLWVRVVGDLGLAPKLLATPAPDLATEGWIHGAAASLYLQAFVGGRFTWR